VTASSIAARSRADSSSRSPAAVVPPGDVTAARNAAGPSSLWASNVAEPSSVCSTSFSDTSRVNPTSTPASIIASATRKTYAGPDPDRPVTASSADSLTVTTIPTAPSKRDARSRCWLVAWRPAAIADAPNPTSAGVLGIARTTGRPGASASNDAIVTPAAIDNTRVSGRSEVSAASRLAATSPGLTATITTSASATAHAGLGTTRTFGKSRSSSRRRSASTSATDSASGSHPPSSSPPSSAEPIFPPPISAALVISPRVMGPTDASFARVAAQPPSWCRSCASDALQAPHRGNTDHEDGPEEPSRSPRTSPNGAASPAPRARQLHFRLATAEATVALGSEAAQDLLSHLDKLSDVHHPRRNAIPTATWNHRSTSS